MKFFIDTAEVKDIIELNKLGIVDGVTTNPSLILKSGKNMVEVIKEISNLVDGPISAEVVSAQSDGMIAEGLELLKISKNIAFCIKNVVIICIIFCLPSDNLCHDCLIQCCGIFPILPAPSHNALANFLYSCKPFLQWHE